MGASGAVGAYEIERSLRFDKTIDQNLQFTPSSDGNRRTWTFSCWLKRSVIGGGSQSFFRCREGSYPKGLVMARFLNDELDINFIRKSKNIIKLDVQGDEIDILKGLKDKLSLFELVILEV